MAIFKGAGVAIVTPMHEDGSINYEAFGDLIEFQIANHTDAIIAAIPLESLTTKVCMEKMTLSSLL